MSDFPKSAARVAEGFCPLCDGELVDVKELGNGTAEIDGMKMDVSNVRVGSGRGATCPPCDVTWGLNQPIARQTLADPDDGSHGPQISVSRTLRPDEVKRLYDRGDEPTPRRRLKGK